MKQVEDGVTLFSEEESNVIKALKSIARNQQVKTKIQGSEELYPLLKRAAKRFIAGEIKEDGIIKGRELLNKGYAISLEYIGENTDTVEECECAKERFMDLMESLGEASMPSTISLDLSHIGLSVHSDIALKNLIELAAKAKKSSLYIMISMEESNKTDRIIEIYKKVSREYDNVGLTLQAHLNRSEDDILDLLHYPGKIRLVKGAYQEPPNLAITRSDELNHRYLQFAELLIKKNHPTSIATHDESIIQELKKRGHLNQDNVELEMLYGVRADFMKRLKDGNYKTRVYLTYGTEWYLYLCHRLAEYPPNIYVALTDMITPHNGNQSLY
ncbi:proline dehydrogenase family protein [Priestia endophytica]|uniref:proline dehydrogenase family protein n=1 Tax=Priestia filamentosa TaxID=1402861 RepID=UPI003D2CD81A